MAVQREEINSQWVKRYYKILEKSQQRIDEIVVSKAYRNRVPGSVSLTEVEKESIINAQTNIMFVSTEIRRNKERVKSVRSFWGRSGKELIEQEDYLVKEYLGTFKELFDKVYPGLYTSNQSYDVSDRDVQKIHSKAKLGKAENKGRDKRQPRAARLHPGPREPAEQEQPRLDSSHSNQPPSLVSPAPQGEADKEDSVATPYNHDLIKDEEEQIGGHNKRQLLSKHGHPGPREAKQLKKVRWGELAAQEEPRLDLSRSDRYLPQPARQEGGPSLAAGSYQPGPAFFPAEGAAMPLSKASPGNKAAPGMS